MVLDFLFSLIVHLSIGTLIQYSFRNCGVSFLFVLFDLHAQVIDLFLLRWNSSAERRLNVPLHIIIQRVIFKPWHFQSQLMINYAGECGINSHRFTFHGQEEQKAFFIFFILNPLKTKNEMKKSKFHFGRSTGIYPVRHTIFEILRLFCFFVLFLVVFFRHPSWRYRDHTERSECEDLFWMLFLI